MTLFAQTMFVGLTSCTSAHPDATQPDPPSLGGLDRAERSISREKQRPVQTGRPTSAILDGEAIEPDLLQGALAEAAGAVILEEVILDRLLSRRALDAGISIDPAATDAEKQLLLTSLTNQTGLSPSRASELTDRVLRARGLGPLRFASLVRRNAILRALIQSDVQISEAEVEQAVQTQFGPRLGARVILRATQSAAAEVRSALTDATLPTTPAAVAARFSQAAVEHSADASAPRGGRLDPISPTDASISSMIRTTIAGLKPGEVSPILAVDGGYAFFILEEHVPALAQPTPADRAATASALRLRKEREAMDRLARQLLASASITIFDHSLRWSWEARPGRGQ